MTTRLLLLFMLVSTTFVGALSHSVAGAQEAQARFWVEGPQNVELDSPIDLRFGVDGIENVAGFEAVVLFDTSAAAFRGHELRNTALARNGRSVGALSAVEQDYGIALGAYTCSLNVCVEERSGEIEAGIGGRLRLGSVSLLGLVEGRIQVTFSEIKLVDARGEAISTSTLPQTIWVNVGENPESQTYPSPISVWGLRSDPGATRNYDVVPDDAVSYADAAEVSLSWVDTRELENPCASLWDAAVDVNKDGCVDIADVQLVAANYGVAAGDESAPPDDGRDGAGSTIRGSRRWPENPDFRTVRPPRSPAFSNGSSVANSL